MARRMRVKITEAEMREHARKHIRGFDGMDRPRAAFAFLEYLSTNENFFYTTAQIRGAAIGLRQGMSEGIR